MRPADIIVLAERLGAGLFHCRVDVYDCDDTLIVGELTLYSQSGLTVYANPADDFVLGAPWVIRRPTLSAFWTVATRRWEILPPRTPTKHCSL